MNFLCPEPDVASLRTSATSAVAGNGLFGAMAAGAGAGKTLVFDLEDPETNLMAKLKIRRTINRSGRPWLNPVTGRRAQHREQGHVHQLLVCRRREQERHR